MRSCVRHFAQCGVVIVAWAACLGLTGCGDGGGIAAASSTPTAAEPVTQSNIVLPSSVQIVTAK